MTVFSKRGLDYLAGALLVAMVATIVVSISTSQTPDTFREDARGVLQDIVEDRDLFIVSIAFDLASNLILIPMAAALFLVFSSRDRALALLGSVGFLAAGLLFLVVDMVAIPMISLAEDYAGATGAQADSILHAARAIGLMTDVAIAMGAVGFALGALSYGLLVLTTNALPRWMGVFGIAGGIVTPFMWLLFVDTDLVAVGYIGLMIVLFFTLITGAWLIWGGRKRRPSSPTYPTTASKCSEHRLKVLRQAQGERFFCARGEPVEPHVGMAARVAVPAWRAVCTML